jgi:hypothetical protein
MFGLAFTTMNKGETTSERRENVFIVSRRCPSCSSAALCPSDLIPHITKVVHLPVLAWYTGAIPGNRCSLFGT